VTADVPDHQVPIAVAEINSNRSVRAAIPDLEMLLKHCVPTVVSRNPFPSKLILRRLRLVQRTWVPDEFANGVLHWATRILDVAPQEAEPKQRG
jgi:hypothetical protein